MAHTPGWSLKPQRCLAEAEGPNTPRSASIASTLAVAADASGFSYKRILARGRPGALTGAIEGAEVHEQRALRCCYKLGPVGKGLC